MAAPLPPPPTALERVLLRWARRRAEMPGAGAPPDPAAEVSAEGRPAPNGRPDSDTLTLLVTRDEAARALYFFARVGVGAVVVDAAPDDWTPAECAEAHGTVLPLAEADTLPHATANAAPCRCRYRAAPPGTALRPSDAVWVDA